MKTSVSIAVTATTTLMVWPTGTMCHDGEIAGAILQHVEEMLFIAVVVETYRLCR